ncbi:MAG: hypothetical protein Q7S88_02345 [Candidatus Daviesbacteria bacterium]|nr:hypothetical protein [Candidatus Daviesbacteria bacterium]
MEILNDLKLKDAPYPLQKEVPGGPNIYYKFFFGEHGTKRDYALQREHIEQADIVIDESVGWDHDLQRNTQEVIDGRRTPEEELARDNVSLDNSRYAIYLSELQARYNTQKPFGYIDLPLNHHLLEQSTGLLRTFGLQGALYFMYSPANRSHEDFSDFINDWQEYVKAFALIQKQREEYMLSQLDPTVQSIIQNSPDLKDKKEIQVLLVIGAVHTGLYIDLKKKLPDKVSREFSNSPYNFDYESEALRAFMFEKQVDDILLARSLLQRVLQNTLDISSLNFGEFKDSLREIGSEFLTDDVEEVFQSAENREDVPASFLRKIRSKGLDKKFPASRIISLLAA